MTVPAIPPDRPGERPGDRRRTERRFNARVADLTLPELRRMLVTTSLFAVVLLLFVWMVRTVIIAAILGIVIAAYARPLYRWLLRVVRSTTLAGLLALMLIILPVLAALVYSYIEIHDVTEYLSRHQEEISHEIDAAVRRLPFAQGGNPTGSVREWVGRASNYGTAIPSMVRSALASFSIAAAVFLFTAFYVFTDSENMLGYARAKVPQRYGELVGALESNVRGVLYGAIYATLLTQALKSVIILLLMLVFHVPLAGVLAILSFIIGFFPIVGSWSVYLPVAAWLLVFRNDTVGAIVMVVIGVLLNTLFISMYVRPKLAADKSRVLNFYWMFVGLVTGVYTFGLVGILLGPILIGLLKAVVDTVSPGASWRMVDEPEAPEAGA